jgi:SAM-dependent methyltransferase
MSAFGEQRLVRSDVSSVHRLLYRIMGVPDPAHYTHHRNLRSALDGVPSFRPKRILDAGSGAGDHTIYLARRYPDADILGVDLDSALVDRANESVRRIGLRNIRFEAADLTAFESPADFDLIISIDVLEHIPDQPKALRRLAQALRPGGWSYYHIPTVRLRPAPFSNHLDAFHDWAEEEHLAKELTAEEFVHAVRDSGLDVVESRRTFGYWTAEMATSLFALGFRDSAAHRIYQAAVAPVCRMLAIADGIHATGERYAVSVLSQRKAAAPAA